MGGCIVKKKIMDISVITSKKSHFFNEKCIICWDKLPRHIYIPCGHFGVCTDCKIKMNESPHLNGCPYCNNESSELHEIFFCGKKYEKSDENILYLICKLNKKVKILNEELKNERTSNKKMKESIKEKNDMNASIKEENDMNASIKEEN